MASAGQQHENAVIYIMYVSAEKIFLKKSKKGVDNRGQHAIMGTVNRGTAEALKVLIGKPKVGGVNLEN